MKHMMLFIVLVAGLITAGGCKSTTIISNEEPITVKVSGAISLTGIEGLTQCPNSCVQGTIDASKADDSQLIGIASHWRLLTLILALLVYIAAIAKPIREKKQRDDKATDGHKATPKNTPSQGISPALRSRKWLFRGAIIRGGHKTKTTRNNDNHILNLRWLTLIEVALIILSIVTLLRIITPLFTNATQTSDGLDLLGWVLALGFVVLLVFGAVVWFWPATWENGNPEHFWILAAIVLVVAAIVFCVSRTIPWSHSPWPPTPDQTDAFILAGFLVIVCLLALRYLYKYLWIFVKKVWP